LMPFVLAGNGTREYRPRFRKGPGLRQFGQAINSEFKEIEL